MKYIIYGIKEEGEMACTTLENWYAQPILQKTVDGTDCVIYQEFEASSYEEAQRIFNEYMGF